MWSRAKLKEKAKYTFKLNYWKVVLVSLLVNVIAVGIGSQSVITNNFETIYNESFDDTEDDFPDWYDYEDGYYYDDVYGYEDDFFFDGRNNPDIDAEKIGLVFVSIFLIVIVCFIIVYLIVVAVGMVWAAFIGNPVEVGAKRFFFKSLNEKAEVKEIAFAFDSSYKNVAKIMFLRTLYTMFWTWLFIIPGIVKGYEYRMIPYLLAENPNLTKEQAFTISRQMMMGQKMKAFVLDLSFIGWHILSVFTLGILSVFYVSPYINMTNVALYEELSIIYGRPALHVQQPQQKTYTAPEG